MKKLSVKSGFTIVELLVVIVVLGVLASVTVVAYNGVQKRARDSQRLAALSAIVKGVELYRTTNGSFPPVLCTGLGCQ